MPGPARPLRLEPRGAPRPQPSSPLRALAAATALGLLALACAPDRRPPAPTAPGPTGAASPVPAPAQGAAGASPALPPPAGGWPLGGPPEVLPGGGLRLRLEPQPAPQVVVSPDGRHLALAYGATPPGGPPQAVAAVVGEGFRILTHVPAPTSGPPGATLSVGPWLDNQRLFTVAVTRDGSGPPAVTITLWDLAQGQVRTWPRLPLRYEAWGARLIQRWLTRDGQALVANSGDLWRLDLATGDATVVKQNVPAQKHAGPVVVPSPDGWRALTGGGVGRARRAVVDLRTGQEQPLPPRWQVVNWTPEGHLAVLTGDPLAEVNTGESVWVLHPSLQVVGLDGTILRTFAAPGDWRFTRFFPTPDGQTAVGETARREPVGAQPGQPWPMVFGPVLAIPLAGGTPHTVWQPTANPQTPAFDQAQVVGRWLVAEGVQWPLDGGTPVPLPPGTRRLLATAGPTHLVALQADGAVIRFAAGASAGTAVAALPHGAGPDQVQAAAAGPWVVIHAPVGAERAEALLFRIE